MDFAGHYVIAALVGLAVFGRRDWKKILALSLLAVLPDFDFFFGLHRVLFHNIFFAVIIGLAVYAVLKKTGDLQALKHSAFASAAVISHLLLDLGRPGIALFYPLLGKGLFLEFRIGLFELYSFKARAFLDYGLAEISVKTMTLVPELERALLSDITAAILAMVALALLLRAALPGKK